MQRHLGAVLGLALVLAGCATVSPTTSFVQSSAPTDNAVIASNVADFLRTELPRRRRRWLSRRPRRAIKRCSPSLARRCDGTVLPLLSLVPALSHNRCAFWSRRSIPASWSALIMARLKLGPTSAATPAGSFKPARHLFVGRSSNEWKS